MVFSPKTSRAGGLSPLRAGGQRTAHLRALRFQPACELQVEGAIVIVGKTMAKPPAVVTRTLGWEVRCPLPQGSLPLVAPQDSSTSDPLQVGSSEYMVFHSGVLGMNGSLLLPSATRTLLLSQVAWRLLSEQGNPEFWGAHLQMPWAAGEPRYRAFLFFSVFTFTGWAPLEEGVSGLSMPSILLPMGATVYESHLQI